MRQMIRKPRPTQLTRAACGVDDVPFRAGQDEAGRTCRGLITSRYSKLSEAQLDRVDACPPGVDYSCMRVHRPTVTALLTWSLVAT